jgi:hypothetical protein
MLRATALRSPHPVIRSAIALLASAAAMQVASSPVSAQTVLNITNVDGALLSAYAQSASVPQPGSSAADTILDAVNRNTSLAIGLGGTVAGSALGQTGANQLNAVGLGANGSFVPVVFPAATANSIESTPTVEINTLTAAGNALQISVPPVGEAPAEFSGRTSLTVSNLNASVVLNPQVVPGASGAGILLGSAIGSAAAAGGQSASNVANAVAGSFASGTLVTLNQLPLGLVESNGQAVTGAQGGALNMSAVNTLLAYTANGAADVVGSSIGGAGAQAAQNRFNVALVLGDVGLQLAQKADGLDAVGTTFQSANRALAFNGNAGARGLGASVGTLVQSADVAVNALGLGPNSGTAGAVTLSGEQSIRAASAFGTVVPVSTNQMVATTIELSGFVPDSGIAVNSSWNSFADNIGVPGLGQPGVVEAPRVVNAAPWAADVRLDRIGQSISTNYNSVVAGNVVVTATPLLGGIGFTQAAGTVVAPSAVHPSLSSGNQVLYFSPLGLNSAVASTDAGNASAIGATQAYGFTVNTFGSSADIRGGIGQSLQQLDFGSAAIVGSQDPGYGGYVRVDPNAGSGGEANGSGPYSLLLGPTTGLYTNTLRAVTALGGDAAVRSAAQQTNVAANILVTSGTIDTGTSGLVAQTFDRLEGFGATNDGQRGFSSVPMQSIQAGSGLSLGSGTSTVIDFRQVIGMQANVVAAGEGGVGGSVSQAGPAVAVATGSLDVTNYAGSLAAGRGSATLGGGSDGTTQGVQQVALGINRIETTGTIGSIERPAAIQQSSGVGTRLGGGPANVAEVVALGSSGDAVGRNLVQTAAVGVNSISAGGSTLGNVTQLGSGLSSTTGNLAVSGAFGCCQLTGSANALLRDASQTSIQSVNALTTGSLGAGLLNQTAGGGTALQTANRLQASASLGTASITGSQVASNSLNLVGGLNR